MVQCNLLFKKRRGTDLNNFDFVMDPEPIGVNPVTGFPIYREITDPSIVTQDYNATYKQLNTTDDYGLFTEFLIRPGIRKLRQQKVQLTVEQKGNAFSQPSHLIGFFGFRPGLYDHESGVFTPLIDYFQHDRSSSLLCDNSMLDLEGTGPSDISTLINEADFCPSSIEQFGALVPVDTYNVISQSGTYTAGTTTTTFPYDGDEDFSTISETDLVVFEQGVPGMDVSGSFTITNWTLLGGSFPVFDFVYDSTACPQGPVISISSLDPAQPDAFVFAAPSSVVIANSPITITNMPSVTNANGTFTAVNHPLGSGFIQLVERADQGVSYTSTQLSDLIRTENEITNPTLTFKAASVETYRLNPLKDFTYITTFEHITSLNISNRIYTSHSLITPLFNHNIDSAAFPDNFALQAKVVIYVARIEYKTSELSDSTPVLRLIPSDDISSFSADVDLI